MAVEFVPNDHIALGTWELSGSAMSLSAWVLQDTTPSDSRIIMKGTGTSSGAHWWGLIFNGGNDKPEFRLFTSGYDFVPATTALTSGVWYHVCGTYDGSNMRIYINGVLENTLAKTGTIRGTGGAIDIWLGDQPADPGARPHDGKLDDVRIYDRALSTEEIGSIFIARGIDGIVEGGISRYLLNEGAPGVTVPAAAGTIKDVWGPNNGTQSGDPTYAAGVTNQTRAVA